jgi:hypothetical protein
MPSVRDQLLAAALDHGAAERYYDDLTEAQTADTLGVSVGAGQSGVARADRRPPV